MSVAHIIANLRTEIEEYGMMQPGKIRMNKGGEFLSDVITGTSARNSQSKLVRQ
jgi:hypothetical protein